MMRVSTSQFFQSGLNRIIEQQEHLLDLQSKISSQKRVETPSDDPVAFNRIFTYEQEINIAERYMYNASIAQHSNEQEEAVLNTSTDLLQQTNQLIIQSNNAALTEDERNTIAIELEQIQEQMLGLANTKVNGEYLFAGYTSNTEPFTKSNSTFNYNGAQKAREIQINETLDILYADSGFDAFVDINQGNGDFKTAANAANTGNGVIDIGSITDKATYDSVSTETFTISFVTNSSGELAYNVFGSASGQVIPTLPTDATTGAPDFEDGDAINFSGMSVSIDNTPVAGDSFTLQPSVREDVFTTLQRAIDAVRMPQDTDAEKGLYQNEIASVQQNVYNALDNIDKTRSKVGARLSSIDTQFAANETFIYTAKKALSDIRDIDPAKVISELAQVTNVLEASQASYARIQNLSLFNYI
jgi:flagellar hook-associated protein 3 FlgL